MSAAPVPVTAEFILRRDAFLADLRATSAEFQTEVRRMTSTPIEVAVRMDDQLTSQIEELIADFRKQAIRLPLVGTDTITPILEEIRKTEAAKPIVIPVEYEPVNGPGGIPGGGGTPLPGTGPVNALNLLNGPSAPNTPGEAGAAEEAVTGGGRLAGIRSSINSFPLRRIFLAAAVARAGYDTLSAGGDAISAIQDSIQFNGKDDPMRDINKVTADIKAGQDAIKRLPFLGSVIEGTGSALNRAGSASLNYLRGVGRGEILTTKNIESDVGYGERLGEEQKKIDETLKQRDKEIAVRTRLFESMDAETKSNERAIALIGKSGVERERADSEYERGLIEKKYIDAKYKDRLGQLTETAKAAKDSELKLIDARDAEAQRLRNQRGAVEGYEYQAGQARLSGNFGAAEQLGFSARLASARGEAANRGELAGFDILIGPQMRAQFAQDQAREYITRSRGLFNFQQDATEAGREADLRGANRNNEAGLSARNYRAGTQLRDLQQQFDLEPDARKRADLQNKIDAESKTVQKEQAANFAEFVRRNADETFSYEDRARRTNLELTKNDYQAQRSEVAKRWDYEISKIEDAGAKNAARLAKDADLQRMATEQAKRSADLRESTREINLRTAGLGGVADVDRIRYDLQQSLREAGNDPTARKDAIANTLAQTRSLIRGQMGQSQTFGSSADFARGLQSSILNFDQAGFSAANDFAKQLSGALKTGAGVGRDSLDNPFGESTKKFGDAADKWDKIADKWNGVQFLR